MKKLSIILSVVMLLSFCTLSLCGCITHNIKAGPMKDLVGTYKLATYDVTPDATEETADLSYEERTHNYLDERGIQAYVIITGTDSGYYLYKDNQTDWWCESISLSYSYETDDEGNVTDKIREVEFDTHLSGASYTPGQGRESVGFNNKKHNLNYTHHSYHGKWIEIKDTTKVVYEKVSKDTTLGYVQEKIGRTFQAPRYELKLFKGILLYYCYFPDYQADVLNDMIYCYVDFDNVTFNATVYYALKSDYANGLRGEQLQKTKSVTATFDDGDSYFTLDFHFDDVNNDARFVFNKGIVAGMANGEGYVLYAGDETNGYHFVEEAGRQAIESLEVAYMTDTLANTIAQCIADYEETLQYQEPVI